MEKTEKYIKLNQYQEKENKVRQEAIEDAIRNSDNKDDVHVEWLAEDILEHLQKSGHHLVQKDEWAAGLLNQVKDINERLLIVEGALNVQEIL